MRGGSKYPHYTMNSFDKQEVYNILGGFNIDLEQIILSQTRYTKP